MRHRLFNNIARTIMLLGIIALVVMILDYQGNPDVSTQRKPRPEFDSWGIPANLIHSTWEYKVLVEAYAELDCRHAVYTGWQHIPDNEGLTLYDRTKRAVWGGTVYTVRTGTRKGQGCLVT